MRLEKFQDLSWKFYVSDILVDRLIIFLVESVRFDDDEESEELEDDDIFVFKEFVEIREGDV